MLFRRFKPILGMMPQTEGVSPPTPDHALILRRCGVKRRCGVASTPDGVVLYG